MNSIRLTVSTSWSFGESLVMSSKRRRWQRGSCRCPCRPPRQERPGGARPVGDSVPRVEGPDRRRLAPRCALALAMVQTPSAPISAPEVQSVGEGGHQAPQELKRLFRNVRIFPDPRRSPQPPWQARSRACNPARHNETHEPEPLFYQYVSRMYKTAARRPDAWIPEHARVEGG